MAADEPLREEDLPPPLREQGSATQHPERNDPDQPMINDLVYRPGESSGQGARDAIARDSDPPGKIERLGTATPQPTGADAGDGASQRDRDDAPANEPNGAADKPPVDNVVADARSSDAAPLGASEEGPVGVASDASPSAIPPASPNAQESGDGDANLDAAAEDSSTDEGPADSLADTGDTAAMDSQEVSSPAESATSSADVAPPTTADSSSEAGDGPAQATAGSPPNAPAASPGLAQGQVTSAAGSQQREEDLPPRTTDLLTPGPDGQPPMARPIVLVRLTDDLTHRMVNDALAKCSADSSALMESIAADHVDYIFWQIRAEERAILRFD